MKFTKRKIKKISRNVEECSEMGLKFIAISL